MGLSDEAVVEANVRAVCRVPCVLRKCSAG